MDLNGKYKYGDIVMIVAGSVIMGFSIKNFYDAAGLVTGGVTGLAIIIKNLSGIDLWVSNTVLNIPLFIAAYKLKGWPFISRSLIATATLSAALGVIPEVNLVTDDLFLSALFGGALNGVGIGLVFAGKGTTGGTDMLASLIRIKFKQYSLAEIMRVIDAVIVITGAGIFGAKYAMYALIAVFIVTKVSDGMIEGMKFSKAVFIISEKSAEISEVILRRIGRGVTAMKARGMYTGSPKEVLFCVVSKKEIVTLKEFVADIDPDAFLIVTDAREVLGEGFIEPAALQNGL